MANFVGYSDSHAVSAEYKARLQEELAALARDYKVGGLVCPPACLPACPPAPALMLELCTCVLAHTACVDPAVAGWPVGSKLL